VPPSAALRIAVYAPDGKLMRIADSRHSPAAMPIHQDWLARVETGGNDLGCSTADKSVHDGGSCQSLFCVITVCPEYSCRNGIR
jgi:hypothetical protein